MVDVPDARGLAAYTKQVLGNVTVPAQEVDSAVAQNIQREDVITEVDGKRVTNVASFRNALNTADPRKGILLYLDRKGSKTFAVLKAPQ